MGRIIERLQARVRKWPLRTKLLAVVLSTVIFALALAGAGMIASDSVLFTRYLERDLTALSEIVADTSTGALAFDDPAAAAETLGALRARTHLVGACIYRLDGTVLARYWRTKPPSQCPPPSVSQGVSFLPTVASVSRPVLLAGRPVGSLLILYDYGEIYERRTLFGGAVLLILFFSSLLAAILSARLRDMISNPVSSLVQTVTSVSVSRNYSLRAQKASDDELGILVDEFNEMLSRIQARDEELREALAQREEANRQLAQSNADLERFAFIASHDLQEPLRMVAVYTQLLQRRSLLQPSPETAEFVAYIIGGTRRMHELLDDLRVYAELGAQADVAVVDLNSALQKAQANLKLAIETSAATIQCTTLPRLKAYEGHVVALFQNLIGNAIKYRSQKRPEICISYRHEDGHLQFAVADNGRGIDPEYHTKIFVPFKRLHGADIPGSGIGLAICHRVVERYGGRIWVQSQLGEGATFLFAFPDSLLVPQSGSERISNDGRA